MEVFLSVATSKCDIFNSSGNGNVQSASCSLLLILRAPKTSLERESLDSINVGHPLLQNWRWSTYGRIQWMMYRLPLKCWSHTYAGNKIGHVCRGLKSSRPSDAYMRQLTRLYPLKWWLAACSAPSHYLNQCRLFIDLTTGSSVKL